MSYRTILVHADHSENATARIQLAAGLAQQEEAHLIGVAMSGIPRQMTSSTMFEGSGLIMADCLRHVAARADQALARFSEVAARAGMPACETRRDNDDEYTGLCLQARYADLVVLGQPNPDDPGDGGLLTDLPAHVILHSGRPVLLVPYAGSFAVWGTHPLIAWDGSVEAMRAITAALPLLRRAAQVTVAMFNPEVGSDAHGEEPGADIALYLARHGVKVEVMRCPTTIDTGNSILSLAATISADLLVMGCYGHSRLREKIMGGATRTVLATMTLPVLMAH